MDELRFAILMYRHKVPILAGCRLCDLKFITPRDKMKDAEAAELYLREKYRLHECKHEDTPTWKWHS